MLDEREPNYRASIRALTSQHWTVLVGTRLAGYIRWQASDETFTAEAHPGFVDLGAFPTIQAAGDALVAHYRKEVQT